jgi:hypothetical protein
MALNRLIVLESSTYKKVPGVAMRADADLEENRNGLEVAERLRHAVELAGGPSRISAQSGIPLRSLGHYLGGRDMRRAALVALADACGTSIEWLATGRGQMLSEAQRKFLSIRMYQPSEDKSRLVRTPAYERHLQEHPESAPKTHPLQAPSQSQSESSVREHQESVTPPPAIHVPRLKQAMDIIRAIGGTGALEAEDAAAQIAATYDILAGTKP